MARFIAALLIAVLLAAAPARADDAVARCSAGHQQLSMPDSLIQGGLPDYPKLG
jgi:hypothetical protein